MRGLLCTGPICRLEQLEHPLSGPGGFQLCLVCVRQGHVPLRHHDPDAFQLEDLPELLGREGDLQCSLVSICALLDLTTTPSHES